MLSSLRHHALMSVTQAADRWCTFGKGSFQALGGVTHYNEPGLCIENRFATACWNTCFLTWVAHKELTGLFCQCFGVGRHSKIPSVTLKHWKSQFFSQYDRANVLWNKSSPLSIWPGYVFQETRLLNIESKHYTVSSMTPYRMVS